ncbi:GNAT family N-acetyltransferase [Lentilitoribacter sp. Alg239-R112]|uniref:GNAT family N-acetyltransferase n=1 Tax=Lentilitoribacter sp. Alg239-R112 TaxID=2305987 RepID=UPI0013A6AFFB|nr:GNAT family N-acetyltransferase [Lentilitoribacter sp. Alg239-R112]
MIIRAARSIEIKTLAALGVLAWEQALENSGENTQNYIKGAQATYFHFCSENWPIISVIEVDGEVLGWGAVDPNKNNITDIWVLPDFQCQGLGSLLLTELEKQISERGFETIELETHAKNINAISFFKKHGFAVSSLKSSYVAKLDKTVDTIEMRKTFE